MGGLADTLKTFGSSPAASVGGTILTAGSQLAGGIGTMRARNYEAAQGDVAAGQAIASSQRAGENEMRKSKLLQSRAQAVAAASGAGASDRTVTDIIANIAQEGSYRSQLAQYEGAETARVLRTRAEAARLEGRSSAIAGGLRGVSTIISGGRTLFDKYGGKRLSSSDFGGVEPYRDESGWGMT